MTNISRRTFIKTGAFAAAVTGERGHAVTTPDGGTVRVLLYGTDETLAMQLALAAACGVPQVFGQLCVS